MMDLIYKALPYYDEQEVKRIFSTGSVEELQLLPLSVGEYCSDWKTAQDICLRLTDYPDEYVRANAALGLAYIARNHRKLERNKVEPVIVRLLNECTEFRWRILDAVSDINVFMKWQIPEEYFEM